MEYKHQNQLIPKLKKVEPDFGSSIRYSRFTERNPDAKAFWHYHPEVELVYIEKGYGNRYVGNHISSFDKGDLILMGPNLPHFGYEFGLQGINEEIVVQFREELINESSFNIPEFENVNNLIQKSKSGISFFGATKKKIGEELLLMEDKDPFDKLLNLLKILNILAQSTEFQVLNADGITLVIQNQGDDRINKVYQYVKENYQAEISLEEISEIAIMTVPSFCRYFKKYTKQTFTQFVNEFRVRQAIRLIAAGNKSITQIAMDVGFNNFSHFNKQFKKVTGKSASQYKRSMYQILK